MPRHPIATDSAPAAIGPYSQAVRSGNSVFLSGQIPLDPATGQLVEGDIATQSRRVFDNLAAGIVLSHDEPHGARQKDRESAPGSF